ncbi:hypothetical protein RRG08_038302 [Elysia crispata]|uniref:Uncharacterized protein n=1 Tax=Elysia crispata TaxID=231223 RepID=A0AAE1APA2_9GAST|nr:hypothetical protein RRG08_038302 [Elysia crispata]
MWQPQRSQPGSGHNDQNNADPMLFSRLVKHLTLGGCDLSQHQQNIECRTLASDWQREPRLTLVSEAFTRGSAGWDIAMTFDSTGSHRRGTAEPCCFSDLVTTNPGGCQTGAPCIVAVVGIRIGSPGRCSSQCVLAGLDYRLELGELNKWMIATGNLYLAS